MNWRAFFRGMASISIYQPPIRGRFCRDDREALRHDWEMVGQDMRQAIEKHEQEWRATLRRQREKER